MNNRTLMIWTKYQHSSPAYCYQVKGSARRALSQYGYTAAQIKRVIDDLHSGHEVMINDDRIQLR